ncbi:hypothetical protein ACJRO7_014566 [Eucalyptus globulus]|uniref:Uncharacterized protein n=1 Tax=Eucalyptus globulus TaxID=34317 RepID=A0ABD3L0M6_EUCGL
MLFNHELKSSSPRLLFCCFQDATVHHEAAPSDYSNDGDSDGSYRGATRSPCLWLHSMARELPLCRKQGHIATLEFGYDMMSYALNFEGDRGWEANEESPARNFTAMLPVSLDRLLSNAERSRSV